MSDLKKVCEHGVTLGWHCGDCRAERLQRELTAANARADKLRDTISETIGATTEYAEWKDITEMLQKALADARKGVAK